MYRREVLAAFGGTAAIGYSEDVHTGFNCITPGFKLKTFQYPNYATRGGRSAATYRAAGDGWNTCVIILDAYNRFRIVFVRLQATAHPPVFDASAVAYAADHFRLNDVPSSPCR